MNGKLAVSWLSYRGAFVTSVRWCRAARVHRAVETSDLIDTVVFSSQPIGGGAHMRASTAGACRGSRTISDRRIAFNEDGIFRRYKVLDI
jgi:hypothetical protein